MYRQAKLEGCLTPLAHSVLVRGGGGGVCSHHDRLRGRGGGHGEGYALKEGSLNRAGSPVEKAKQKAKCGVPHERDSRLDTDPRANASKVVAKIAKAKFGSIEV